MQGSPQTADQLLETIRKPSPHAEQVRKTWLGKPPEEQVAAGRKLFYGIVSPTLSESHSEEQVAEIEALFDCIFQNVEQASMQKGRRTQSV